MKKNILFRALVSTIVGSLLMSATAFASKDIITLEDKSTAITTLGDEIIIDLSKPSNTTKTVQDILGNDTRIIDSMPTNTWAWNDGVYFTDFLVNTTALFSDYLFTGYSRYYIDIFGHKSGGPTEDNTYYLFIMTHETPITGPLANVVSIYEINSPDLQSLSLINADPGQKYAVSVSMVIDGSFLGGNLYVGCNPIVNNLAQK
jgi:hypothetical protein